MREYEITIVVQSKLEDQSREQVLNRVQGWITGSSEEVEKPTVTHWGQRKLAYPINKHTDGYYVHYEAKVDPSRIKDIERNMQFSEDILRYLVVRKD